ncbi:hypothetical protein P7K49_005632 [Saguinus oedipus]|uniref:Uncharacterized protein n=1 Tax=Saguinus oedipus TaxID=9490 RepID=A0ABQ9W040_SAGOE|nr:hypothetical protein P7K49_005632 [Saguinus oedipus]
MLPGHGEDEFGLHNNGKVILSEALGRRMEQLKRVKYFRPQSISLGVELNNTSHIGGSETAEPYLTREKQKDEGLNAENMTPSTEGSGSHLFETALVQAVWPNLIISLATVAIITPCNLRWVLYHISSTEVETQVDGKHQVALSNEHSGSNYFKELHHALSEQALCTPGLDQTSKAIYSLVHVYH